MRFDDFDTQITCEEFYTDPKRPNDDDPLPMPCPDHDDQPLELDPDDDSADLSHYGDEDWVMDENHQSGPWGEENPQWDPPLYDHAGVTAEGYAVLAKMDAMGDFI